MSYVGHVQDGKVEFAAVLPLANGTRVRVEPISDKEVCGATDNPGPPATLLDRFREFVGIADDLPTDMATQHDHYLYGTPKR